jgi:hypothetical protein
LPGSQHDLDTESRVAWAHRLIGMGLQFERMDAADQAAIDGFIDEHFVINRKA